MLDDEFDRLDPRDIASYLSAWQTKQQREDYRAATIVCSIANLFCEKGKQIEPGDVFPSLPKQRREKSPEHVAEKILSLVSTMGAGSGG